MSEEELIKKATWICCPMCDEAKCVGRTKCQEIKEWCDKYMKAGAK